MYVPLGHIEIMLKGSSILQTPFALRGHHSSGVFAISALSPYSLIFLLDQVKDASSSGHVDVDLVCLWALPLNRTAFLLTASR